MLITRAMSICVFRATRGVIWIGTDIKRGIAAAVCLDDLELSATGLWAYWLLIFSLCVTHTASALWIQGLKKPSEPGWNKYICTFFFGSRSWQVKSVDIASQFGCSAIYWWHVRVETTTLRMKRGDGTFHLNKFLRFYHVSHDFILHLFLVNLQNPLFIHEKLQYQKWLSRLQVQ